MSVAGVFPLSFFILFHDVFWEDGHEIKKKKKNVKTVQSTACLILFSRGIVLDIILTTFAQFAFDSFCMISVELCASRKLCTTIC